MEGQQHLTVQAPPPPPVTQLYTPPLQQTPIFQRIGITNEDGSAQRLKTACSGCRQQKIKCRTNDDLSTPCERCAKMKLTCTYEPRHSRGRPRSESEVLTNDTPKRRLVAKAGTNMDDGFRPFVAVNAADVPVQSHHGPGPPLATTHGGPNATGTLSFYANPGVAFPSSSIAPELRDTVASPSATNNLTSPRLEPNSNYISSAQTMPRSIDGLRLDAEDIDNLFGRFFRYYHPFLPLLDPGLRPNDYFAQSSFLFWSILAVTSRRWPKDTALMSGLRSRVFAHAMATIFSPTAGTSTITAILLLLSWSFPDTQTNDEMPYVFSSALVHSALRIGMNTPDFSQDFSRVKLSLSEDECKRRYIIYAYCLVLYQRSSYCMGNSFGQIPPSLSQQPLRSVTTLPPSLNFQMDLSDVLVRATIAIANNSLEGTNTNLVALDNILHIYAHELNMCESRQPSSLSLLDKLYLSTSRLMLYAFHFFKSPALERIAAWTPAFDVACALIHQLNDLEKSMHVDLYGTSYVSHGALLAACIILRCLKSPFADTLASNPGDNANSARSTYSASTAQALFFSAINMNRNISIAEGDKPAKSAWVLQQLWRSDTVFKHADGSWDLDLHVRSRFSSSVLYDTMLWGREELKGEADASNPRKTPKSFTPISFTQHPSPLTNGASNSFAPDRFEDMVFTQDWIPE